MQIFNVVFSIIIWYVIIVAIIKFLPVLGINPKNKIKQISRTEGEEVTKKTMLKIFGIALSLRIVLYVISLISAIFILKPTEISLDFFLDAWERWDAPRYVSIIENGYDEKIYNEPEPYNLAFFPLYPWVVRLFNLLIQNTRLACLIVSTLFFSAAMPFMYALVAKEYGKKVAALSLIFISIAPFSFFFGAMMTESTFLFTTVLAWYLIKKRKWFAAAIAGAFSSMSRIVGILIVIPYVLELIECNAESFRNHKYKEWFKNCFKQGFWILLIPLGLVVYLAINYHYTGDCFKFLEYQQTFWYHNRCYFGEGIQNVWNEVNGGRSILSKIELFIPQALSYTFAALVMLTCCHRNRSVYTLYYAIYFIINSSDTWLISGSRYMMLAIPLYIMLAERIKNNKIVSIGLIIISTALYGIYSTMYVGGYSIM